MKRAIKHVLFCQLLGSSVVEYTDATFFTSPTFTLYICILFAIDFVLFF